MPMPGRCRTFRSSLVTCTPTTRPRAPEWSSEEALDEAFSEWVPGPTDDAPSAERSIVANALTQPVLAPEPAVSDWAVETAPVAVEPVAAIARRWSLSDDDILPARRGRKRH